MSKVRWGVAYVNPKDVVVDEWAMNNDIETFKKELSGNGQLKPVFATWQNGAWHVDNVLWHYSCALVQAARDLNYQTVVLIVREGNNESDEKDIAESSGKVN